MSRATPDDQLKFLLNCVKHSNNGKVGTRCSGLERIQILKSSRLTSSRWRKNVVL
jgi:hypothetical protein